MEPNEASMLSRFGRQRFRSFSEAAEQVVDALAGVLPGTVVLGRLEPGEHAHRVIEARGAGFDGLATGVLLAAVADGIEESALRVHGAQDVLVAPLEMSNGRIVGVLCAADAQAVVYRPEHQAQLALAARMLSHEWESVELRSELRRLRGGINAGPATDPETGLPNRASFVELLDREWQLVQRGTVHSVLVACRVGVEGDGNGLPNPRSTLALKVAAEVLEGSARGTDRVGRLGEATVGAILIGCPTEDTPAFVARFQSALDRVNGEGQAPIEVACGAQPLDAASSPEEVLGLAEAAAAELRPAGPSADRGTVVANRSGGLDLEAAVE